MNKDNKMQPLNLPPFEAKISLENGKYRIFDQLRLKKVALTPEEWVRQHFINYLIIHKSYPRERMANEIGISLNGLFKRCDTIVYGDFLEPLMVIEYKAPSVPVSNDVFNQIARYNMKLKVPFLVVSNGLSHFCCRIDYENINFKYIEAIPSYEEIRALSKR